MKGSQSIWAFEPPAGGLFRWSGVSHPGEEDRGAGDPRDFELAQLLEEYTQGRRIVMVPVSADHNAPCPLRRDSRWCGMASFVAVLLVLALGHRWSATAFWFTSDKTCGEPACNPMVCRTT